MIYFLFYSLFCVYLARNNAERIEAGKKINHAVNGSIHLSAAFLMLILSGWEDAISLLLLARVVFDMSLNSFRELSLDYVSPSPKSFADRVEKAVFKSNGLLPKIIYLALFLCLQILK